MKGLAMLKTRLAAVLGSFSLTAYASHLVRLQVDQHATSYTVYVVMELDAPAEKVRALLTDDAHLDRLNASITASKIIDARARHGADADPFRELQRVRLYDRAAGGGYHRRRPGSYPGHIGA
jgi:hypothetical protein